MRSERLLRAAGLLLAALWTQAAAALTVFACEPEWAALVRVLAPQAKIFVATHAGQDPHQIEARPGLIAQLRRADLAVCTGASLEAAWLPALQERAANPRARDVFVAADHVEVIDPQPGAIGTPWSGDVHPEGNPHVHADPRNLLLVAQALAQRLATQSPAEAGAIAARAAAFEARWRARIAAWQQAAAALRGMKVAAQHTTFGYLWRWLGIEQVADLEPRPGLPPTPGHLSRLREALRAQPPAAIVIAAYQDPRPGRWLAQQLAGDVPLLTLPATVGEEAGEEELAQWFDGLIERLLAARRAR
jgi:zinc/manganese transport system substrate-binding protein